MKPAWFDPTRSSTRSEWPVAEARSFPFLQSQMQTVFWHPIPQRLNAKNKNKNLTPENDGKISYYLCCLSINVLIAYCGPGIEFLMKIKKDFSKLKFSK